MKIIENSASTNHWSAIKIHFQNAEKVVIASPFLMPDLQKFLDRSNAPNLKEIHLITTLPSNNIDLLKKVPSLLSLLDWEPIVMNEVECNISIDNDLHGKVYIFTNVNGQQTAIVSSANFTEKGLSKNHEWGVEIDDQSFVSALDDSVANCCRFQELSRENVEALAKQIEEYIDKHSEQPTIEIPIDTSPYLKDKVSASSVLSILDPQIAYFLKPVGVSEDPVKDHETFDQETRRVHFSKRRPRAVHKNSVLIWYAVGHGKIASIFQATTEPDRIPEDEITPGTRQARFPWYVDCINRTRDFGTNWMINDLHIGNLRKEFLQKYPDAAVTYVGGNTLGTLNWGQDKVRLSFEFAKFIIEKVEHNIRR